MAGISGSGVGLFLGEFLKKVLLEFLAHASSIVCNGVPHNNVLFVLAGTSAHGKVNCAPVRGKLHRIVEKIDEDFPQPQRICQYCAMLPFRPVYLESEIPIRHEALSYCKHHVGNIAEICRHRSIYNLAAFHTADVQHVVDQGQQVVGAGGDFLQGIPHLRIGGLLQGNVREALDGVHGSAYVVGHVVEEECLCPIGASSFLQSLLQILGQGLFLSQILPGSLGVTVGGQNNHQSKEDNAGKYPQKIFQQKVHKGVGVDVVLILVGVGENIVLIQSIQSVVQQCQEIGFAPGHAHAYGEGLRELQQIQGLIDIPPHKAIRPQAVGDGAVDATP